MSQQVVDAVRASGLLAPRVPVVVMLSGGRDSVCLLDVALRLCAPGAVRALHVNYGLRGERSDADERHCRELCAALEVPLEVVCPGGPRAATGNLQAWARQVRYEAAARLAGELDGARPGARRGQRALVATGHTASDQVETILYRLAASPGRRALLGMAARRGRVVRPLLGVTREQTAAYCRARGLSWREDESNESERFARARVRRGLVSALSAVHPAAQENVLRTAALLREESELLDGLVARELRDAHTIALSHLERLPRALQRLVVIRLAEQATGRLVPQAGERVQEIIALGQRGGRAQLHVGGLASAVVEGGMLRMVRIR